MRKLIYLDVCYSIKPVPVVAAGSEPISMKVRVSRMSLFYIIQ